MSVANVESVIRKRQTVCVADLGADVGYNFQGSKIAGLFEGIGNMISWVYESR
jgi:hypothetical protein